jgi:hypothetical protein
MKRKITNLITVLWIGLVAGTLDITDNLIFNQFRGITPRMVFRYIASGLIGMKAAVSGGFAAVVLGVAIHYTIAIFWTALFYAASRKLAVLTRRPVVSGLVYGGGGLSVYELRCLAALQSSTCPSCGDPRLTNQWRAGSFALYRINYFALGKEESTHSGVNSMLRDCITPTLHR